MKDNKKITAIIVSILIVIIVVLGIAFAYFTTTLNGGDNIVKIGTLDLVLDETSEGISLDNALGVSDSVGLSGTPSTFTLKNNGSTAVYYIIYLDDMEIDPTEVRIDDKYLKYNLNKNGTDSGATPLTNTGVNPNRVLDSGTIEGGGLNTYSLNLWITDEVDGNYSGQVFKGKLRVEVKQLVDEEAESKPTIVFTPNKKTSTDSIMVNMGVLDDKDGTSYKYVIEKDGEIYRETDYQDYNDNLLIELTEKGLYTIEGYATDSDGNEIVVLSGKYSIYKGIDCFNVEFTSDVKEETYTNQDINVDIHVPANTYRFEVSKRIDKGNYTLVDDYIGQEQQTLTLNEEGNVQLKVTAYDSEGNSCVAVSKEYYIDKTKPSCEVTFDGVSGDNGWYKEEDATVSLDISGSSDIASYGLTTSDSTTYNDLLSASQGDTAGTTWYGYVKDEAGNTNSCSGTVKVDTVSPSCEVTFDGVSGDNGWYKDKDVGVSLITNDNFNVATYGLTTSNSVTYNDLLSASQGDTAGTTWYGYVKDEAGNESNCSSDIIKVDTIKPSCEVTFDGVSGDNGWYKEEDATVSLDISGSSDIVSYGLTTSNNATYNDLLSATQSNTNGTTWYGHVKDEAGNTNSCNNTVKVDTTAPSCSVLIDGISGDNGWYKEKDVTLTLSKLDILSDIDDYGLTTSTSTTYNGETTASQGNTSGVTWRGYVTDNAGNTGSCSSAVKVDTTKPSCSVSFSGVSGSNGWYKEKNASVALKVDDNFNMGQYGLTTSSSATYNNLLSETQGNTSGTTWYGHVKDEAGNTNSCKNTVKVDTTKPSCSVLISGTKGTNDWYKEKDVTLTLSKVDALSDIDNYGLTTSTSATYNSKTTASQGDTSGVTWRGYVTDNAGNTGSCSSAVKVDTTKPTISSITMKQDVTKKIFDSSYSDSYFKGYKSTASNFTYYLLASGNSRKYYANAATSDSYSGVSSTKICNSDNTSCVNNNTGILTSGVSSSAKKKVRVTDKAGNVSERSFTVKFYTACQEWFVLKYANILNRYPDKSGLNNHVDQYLYYASGGTSNIDSSLTSNGVQRGTKEYAVISTYWDLFFTSEARNNCGSAGQSAYECTVRHWYYALLERAPESSAVVTQRVNDIGSTEWAQYYNAVSDTSKYPTLMSNFLAVARAENVISDLNTSGWSTSTCYLN